MGRRRKEDKSWEEVRGGGEGGMDVKRTGNGGRGGGGNEGRGGGRREGEEREEGTVQEERGRWGEGAGKGWGGEVRKAEGTNEELAPTGEEERKGDHCEGERGMGGGGPRGGRGSDSVVFCIDICSF